MGGTSILCQRLATILKGKVSAIVTPGTCAVTNIRTFKMTVQGRPTTDGLNNIFFMQKTNVPNQTLNLGFLALLPGEVTRAVNGLIQQGITVSGIAPFIFRARPNMINVFFQSLEPPIQFARKMRRVLNTLPNLAPDLPEPPPTPAFRRLCDQFSRIIGGNQVTEIIGTSCELVRLRNLNAIVMGQRATSPIVRFLNFSFDQLDSQGRALCIGTVTLLRREVNPYLNQLRNQPGITISPLVSRFFSNPDLVYLTYDAVERPLTFARISRQAISVLSV
ncbi:DUF1259 domain-containing protein [Marininema halotolerans]|uniref:Uncharacterized protein n=1 Tax=Marininema halotolerans TaxID=1155944 RepID=A0A1I6SJA5_9BACL|nr:DUF1259 domain-containing protein [Marininema halotolerans]SFS77027.1 protein of unknown function [Marininema halotolerans]